MKTQTFNGKTMSEIASQIAQEYAMSDFAHEEARGFGCPEVGSLIKNSTETTIDRILAAAGLTRQEWNDLVTARTTARWAYFNRMLVDIPDYN